MIAQALLDQLASEGVHSVRVVFADQHGLLKGQTISSGAMADALEHGIRLPGSLLHHDTGGVHASETWALAGEESLDSLVQARNIVMRPDPTTARLLPWLERTALVICDLETPTGKPLPHSSRQICAQAIGRLDERELVYTASLQLTFHLYRIDETGELQHSHAGGGLLGEDHLDRIEPALEPIRHGLAALGIQPATIEAELGASQIRMAFAPAKGINVADEAVLARTAIRHIARRNGYQASFMSRPNIDNSLAGGWHLQQSLSGAHDPEAQSLFSPQDNSVLMSTLGERYVGGLIANAAASCLLTTPTVTGYKRGAGAPERTSWGHEHRGTMLSVIGSAADGSTRVENRVGDPAANPYLYLTSQILSGLDGIENNIRPPRPTYSPQDPVGGDPLPRNLGEAIEAFSASAMYRKAVTDDVANYLTALKRSEWDRFNAAVTDWEHSEYFDQF